MGKFGKNKLPKFMNTADNRMGSNPHIQEDNQDDEMQPVIVSMAGHGDDHAMIVIRTKSGEELELRFDYDGNGMLTATHDDHEYSIPVEIEVVSDEDHEEEEVHMSPSGRMTNMSPADDDYEINYGRAEEVDEAAKKLSAKQKKFLDKDGNGELNKKDFLLLNKNKKKDTEGKVAETFEGFVNECWTPIEESYNLAMSEEAKLAIKALCEDLLIQEAQRCDEDADPMHTYENYLNECGSYMTECMMESAASLPITESTSYSCDTCGERAEHEEIDENPNMKCSNCGHRNWSPEQ